MLRPSSSLISTLHLRRLPLFSLVALPVAALQPGCSDDHYHNHYYYESTASGGNGGNGGNGGSGGSSVGGSSAGGSSSVGGTSAAGMAGAAGEGTEQPEYPGAPVANAEVGEHELDIFGVVGNRYWFGVSDDQLETMNEVVGGCQICDEPLPNGDLYAPGGVSATYVDHLWITAAGRAGKTADYGKVQVKLAGQSTLRAWNPRSIPNLNVDTDEFIAEQRIDGFEHLRFNNGQVGSIFRERLTLELYARLDYPAPLTTFAWVSSNVWAPEISIPYTLVERYKPSFCERWESELGGDCVNMWEFAGDFAQDYGYPGYPGYPEPGLAASIFDDPTNCQFDECDNTRVKELEQVMMATSEGEGYKAALADWIDWPAFHRFQCLSWVLATGDDALHNQNNVVLVERADGRFQYLPYSVDISLGQDWYPVVPLPGRNSISRGCQSDPECWADTISMCEDVIAEFTALDPEALLTSVYDELLAEGMLRPGDDGRYEFLKDWFSARLDALPDELESNREPPLWCDYGQVDCGGYCDSPYNCDGGCVPPGGEPPFEPGAGGAAGADGGGEAGGPGECPPIYEYSVAE